eukprot:3176480-Rhodomonas_salina.1
MPGGGGMDWHLQDTTLAGVACRLRTVTGRERGAHLWDAVNRHGASVQPVTSRQHPVWKAVVRCMESRA